MKQTPGAVMQTIPWQIRLKYRLRIDGNKTPHDVKLRIIRVAQNVFLQDMRQTHTGTRLHKCPV